MWPDTFASRLEAWNRLRGQCQTLPPEQALATINSWWFDVPWRPYYLHWDDIKTWPDPWDLLADNVYCDVARGLGILYTITMLDRVDVADAKLVLTQEGVNLVQVSNLKYILNWDRESIVNNHPAVTTQKQYTQTQAKQQYL